MRPRFDSGPRVFSVPGQNGNGRVTITSHRALSTLKQVHPVREGQSLTAPLALPDDRALGKGQIPPFQSRVGSKLLQDRQGNLGAQVEGGIEDLRCRLRVFDKAIEYAFLEDLRRSIFRSRPAFNFSEITTEESGQPGWVQAPYPKGSFDFVAAGVIPEDAWYVIPEREIRGLKSISLCTMRGEAKYEVYREAGAFCGRRLKSAIRRAEPSSLQRLNRTQRSSQAGCNGWRRQRTTSSGIRSVAVSFGRRQRRARRDSVSVHPAVHMRTFATRPSWTSPREFVPAEGFLLR